MVSPGRTLGETTARRVSLPPLPGDYLHESIYSSDQVKNVYAFAGPVQTKGGFVIAFVRSKICSDPCKRVLVVQTYMQTTCNTKHSGIFFFSLALESTTAILKIVGIVLGALSAFCSLVAGCCKYCCNSNNSQDAPVVQDSENINQIPGFNNYTSQEQVATTKM